VVAAVLAVCECGARIAGSRLDRDRKHIHQFPVISRKFHHARRPRVLFLGNSLTLHGVLPDVVREELASRGIDACEVDWVVPVGTDVTDWVYIYERFFRNVDQTPDIVIIGFVRHHMRDLKPPKRLRRLGRHFLDLRDVPECFNEDVRRFDDRVEVLLSRCWATFGDQPWYRAWALHRILPGFRDAEKRLNRRLARTQEETAARKRHGAPPPAPTFDRVRRLAKLLKDTGAHGIFVAMPLPHIWDHDLQVSQAVCGLGMTYIDARKLDGVAAKDFPDGYHMGDKAKTAYSRFIAGRIADRLQAGRRPSATTRPGPASTSSSPRRSEDTVVNSRVWAGGL
jgi:hypothetical protein